MDIIPAEQCQQEWGDNLGPLTPAQICASRPFGHSCKADSGDYQGYLSLSLKIFSVIILWLLGGPLYTRPKDQATLLMTPWTLIGLLKYFQ